METINLEEILLSKIPKNCYWEDMGNLTNCPKKYVIEAMKEFGKQVLELAAENADVEELYNGKTYSIDSAFCTCDGSTIIANKQSILNVINQIK